MIEDQREEQRKKYRERKRVKLKRQDEDGRENHRSQHRNRIRVHIQRHERGINEATTQIELVILISLSQWINVPIALDEEGIQTKTNVSVGS